MDSMALVFWKDLKDVRGGETFFDSVPGVVNVFFPWYLEERPTFGSDSYYFSDSEAFRYQVGFETDLDTTASEWNFFLGFRNFQ
jgi:hypothetical protein